jgi:hypothetical protein
MAAPARTGLPAAWLDLQVPFCGDYQEASQWTDEEQRTYLHFLESASAWKKSSAAISWTG